MVTKEFTETSAKHALAVADEALRIEIDAMKDLQHRLTQPEESHAFTKAVSAILQSHGRVIVSGMGKSGHIARKIAATLASTGTPAYFLHPGEAAHGDLGMVTANDVFIGISYSGESSELSAILPVVKRIGADIIGMSGNNQSTLAQASDIHLNIGVKKEACILNLAPTASTTVTLAYGDALAIALLDARGFKEEDFALSHPGGALGRRLLTRVKDIMRQGNDIPAVKASVSLIDALMEITDKGIAMTAVVDDDFHPIGVFTDGDLRRLLEKGQNVNDFIIADVMHINPRTIKQDQLAVDAVQLMEDNRINQLLVVDAKGILVGALHIHDLTKAKVI